MNKMPSLCEALCGDKDVLEPLSIYVTDAEGIPKKIGDILSDEEGCAAGSIDKKPCSFYRCVWPQFEGCVMDFSIRLVPEEDGDEYKIVPGPKCPKGR